MLGSFYLMKILALVTAWYCNRLYVNTTGNKGNGNCWLLDSTNWSLINFRINPEFYAFEWHEVLYDYTDDYAKLENDSLGNEFGDYIKRVPDDGLSHERLGCGRIQGQ